MASSAHYRLVSSSGAVGGWVQSSDGRVTERQGFAGSLNDPPRATADTVRRTSDLPGKVGVTSLLSNDSDPEADRFVLRNFDALSTDGGRLSFDNGWLLYEPPPTSPGTDSFTYTIEDAAGNAVSAWVTMLVAGTGPAPGQNLVAITLLPNGHKRITFAGITRRRYRIEVAETLPAAPWGWLATVEADARGVIEWVDATEPAPTARYYRTVAE